MTQIIGTFEWEGESYLRVKPSDPVNPCTPCHFNHLPKCPRVRANLLHCMKEYGGGCFMTKDELIKLKLKGSA